MDMIASFARQQATRQALKREQLMLADKAALVRLL